MNSLSVDKGFESPRVSPTKQRLSVLKLSAEQNWQKAEQG
jgi:hypothetical protein